MTDYVGPLLPSYVTVGNLILTAREANGVEWIMDVFDGWGNTKGTLAPVQRARGDGATGTASYLEMRTMTLSGWVTATNPADLTDALNRLSTAFSLDSTKMTVTESGFRRWANVQRTGEIVTTFHGSIVAEWTVQVVALDPLKYGDAITASTALPSSSGGLTYPIIYPITYTGVSNSGVIHIDNPGNMPAPVYLRIDGQIPAGGWSVNHLGQAKDLAFASSLMLGTGEFVTVDMQKREVLAQGQGQATRNGYVTSRGWFQLNPGPNDIAFSAVAYDPTALLTLTTYPAWS